MGGAARRRERPTVAISALPSVCGPRSGSMDSDTPNRWSRAEAAARAFTHLFVGCRLGVHDQDRIGIVTFTDPGLRHGGDAHPQVKAILPMLPLLTAKD
ncbi:VWA domain-containing protein [Streptomyces sp. NPDC052236]|uniref:VWA domain-containing protein n=1 Tax=Streptomyces sp. NPDC052236 TaxID=3365686 RepID=UPI0037CD8946